MDGVQLELRRFTDALLNYFVHMSMAEEASDKLIGQPPLPTDALLELLLIDAYIAGRGGRRQPQWGPV